VSDIERALRTELRDPEYSEGYAESFLNAYVATQIKVIREQRVMTQAQLAATIGTTQAGISRIENVNYSSWSIRTLIKLARAFGVRLKVSFEPFGTLPDEVMAFNRNALQRVKREEDPGLVDEPGQMDAYQASSRVDPHVTLWNALNPNPVSQGIFLIVDNRLRRGDDPPRRPPVEHQPDRDFNFYNQQMGGQEAYAASSSH
jgi:transcriptional regulator with XRE-family HTH domain